MYADWQQRVIDERKELDERISKLRAFVMGPDFGKVHVAEQGRLLQQEHIMRSLSAVLEQRIHAFDNPDPPARPISDSNKEVGP